MRDLRRAVALLTILPVDFDAEDPAPLGRAMAWYPVVGLGIGLLLAALWWALGERAGLLRAALVLAAWAVVTGGLHLDGWGDCCDGLLAAVEPARRLEILKDPRMGGFGTAGLVLLLLVKLSALAVLTDVRALVLAPVLGRWVVILVAHHWPSARRGGMGDSFRAGLGAREIGSATAIALTVTLVLGGGAAMAGTLLAAASLATFAAGRLGGLTGDVYGAVIEGAETAALVATALLGAHA
jgi:adenosylcobinamide-GDP ribazoletransferase